MSAGRRSAKVNRAWLHDHVTDPYVRLAQKEGYRSRAAYKLREIDEALGLTKAGQVAVDLGAAPGAWSQYLRRRYEALAAGRPGPAAAAAPPQASAGWRVIALDLLPMEPVQGVEVFQGDFRDEDVAARLAEAIGSAPVDLVVSDMAPNLSGVEASDAARVSDLVELAVDFAVTHLKPEGALVCKVFHGSGYSQLVERFKRQFRVVKAIKPKASRDRSAETFLVGRGVRATGAGGRP
ncbi:MAG: RlmE family RNA methyltransferase [Ideonella sp.]|jgi:23S rRNA (uridine2552-2'-O)-methyltransferase|nr:RlmE family RNA methyltransferase [Ideonella sp.]